MRIHTLLAPLVALTLTGCSLYDPLSGQDKQGPDDPVVDPPIAVTYQIPLSITVRGTALDLDSGMTESWWYWPGECDDAMDLVGWDLAGFEQRDIGINGRLGTYATDLEGRLMESRSELFDACRQRGILVTTDQQAVFLLTDAMVSGPNDQQSFTVTATLVEPGICDPACHTGRFDVGWLGRLQVDLDEGLLVETSLAACGVPSDAQMMPFDLLLEPDTITAGRARLAFVPGHTFQDPIPRPAPAAFGLEAIPVPLAPAGVIVVQTDEGRFFKLDVLLDEEGGLIGFDFAQL